MTETEFHKEAKIDVEIFYGREKPTGKFKWIFLLIINIYYYYYYCCCYYYCYCCYCCCCCINIIYWYCYLFSIYFLSHSLRRWLNSWHYSIPGFHGFLSELSSKVVRQVASSFQDCTFFAQEMKDARTSTRFYKIPKTVNKTVIRI